ncbi:MAG: diaminopimelate epimerase [Pseudomonadota bacterium]
MRLSFIKCHGSGNDFPLVDARALDLDDAAWAGVARALADRAGPVGGDGLLLLTAGDERHDFGMRMFNSDGSEAETCLNGLRCVARLGFERLGLDAARVRLRTSSAEVAREAALAPGVVTVRTRVGPAGRDIGLTGPIAGLPSPREFVTVSMPNPHLVTFVDAVDEAELVALGSWCETGPALIPARANVSFVEQRGGDLYVRTFERGVGLTDSCGSAMAASVFAAALAGRVAFDASVTVFNKGGLVRAAATEAGIVTISGNASFVYDAVIDVDPDAARAEALRVETRRETEMSAWASVLADLG